MKLLFTLLGLNRAGRILYITLFVLAIPAGVGWFVLLPRLLFHEEDERLFRAARHGDVAGVEQSLAAGGRLNVGLRLTERRRYSAPPFSATPTPSGCC